MARSQQAAESTGRRCPIRGATGHPYRASPVRRCARRSLYNSPGSRDLLDRAAALVALMLIPTLGRTILLAPPVFQSYSLLLSVSQIEPELLGEVLEIMMEEVCAQTRLKGGGGGTR